MPTRGASNIIDIWRLDLADRTWSQVGGLGQSGNSAPRQSQRAWLGARYLLTRRLGCAPDALRFERGEAGKPRLVSEEIHFNIAHSGDLALIALSAAPVGVDLEKTDPIDEGLEALASNVLQPSELAVWRGAPAERRLALFYIAWVRKEAYLKLTGLGLRKPMTDLRVLDEAGTGLTVLDTASNPGGQRGWLQDLEIDPHFVASVCSPRAPTLVSIHTLTPRDLIADTVHV
jgi:4'-phosphopantetheinyl transferase